MLRLTLWTTTERHPDVLLVVYPLTRDSGLNTMSASASRTYETQNDQQLDELHSKLRTLRSVRLSRLLSDRSQLVSDADVSGAIFVSDRSRLTFTMRQTDRTWT